ncbi:hypothetical protein [Novosphingobium rosa]|uniref:hypothetical protein n=1 Tax=Novosphingobium rosa TaxID=76978 RepID=UPI00082AF1A1|nr:hypothetical protein [Novosphingobium rosa]
MGQPIEPENQLARFREAVALLGGQRPAARAIGINERTMRALHAGERSLHIGFLQDTAKALRLHAEKCKILDRYLAPEFKANLTEAQATKPPRHNTLIARKRKET